MSLSLLNFRHNFLLNLRSCVLLFGNGSFVKLRRGECKKSEESKSSLDIVDEVNVVILLRSFESFLGLNSLSGQTEKGMGNLAGRNFTVEGFVAVSCLDVRNLVAPPHDRLPIRLVVFKESDVVVRVLS